MKNRLSVSLLACLLWAFTCHCRCSDVFPRLVKLASESKHGKAQFELLHVQFDVFEIREGAAIKITDKCDKLFPGKNYLSMFIEEQFFNGLWLDGFHCALCSGSGTDVADLFSFSQCPFIPSVNDISEIGIATRDDFVKSLGIPRYQDENFSYIGFFNIRGDAVKFCWFFLEHSSKRLFVGLSTRTDAVIKASSTSSQPNNSQTAGGQTLPQFDNGEPPNNSRSAPPRSPEGNNQCPEN